MTDEASRRWERIRAGVYCILAALGLLAMAALAGGSGTDCRTNDAGAIAWHSRLPALTEYASQGENEEEPPGPLAR